MTQVPHPKLARAIELAQRDQLQPIQATRKDTGEPLWFLQSRSDPTRYYLLTVASDVIRCCCQQYQHQGMCTHAAAVHLLQQTHQHTRQATPATATRNPAQRGQAEERQRRKEARRREEALPWTDDKPFSMWKS